MTEKGVFQRRFLLGGFSSLVLFVACGDGDPNHPPRLESAGIAGDASSGSGGTESNGGSNAGGNGGNGTPDGGTGGAPAPSLLVLPEQLPAARVGEAYEVELSVQGAQGAIDWVSIGSLPPGLVLTDAGDTAKLSGTPTTAGQFSVGFSLEDELDLEVRNLPLRVQSRPWLVYTTEESVEAVDVATASSNALSEPFVLSRPLVGEEVVWLGDEQPGGLQILFGYNEPLEGQGWVVNFAGPSPSGALRVSPPQGTKDNARDFSWSPDGSRLGFAAETDEADKEGFVVDVSGPAPGAAHKATGAVPAGGSVNSQFWGGNKLVFLTSDPMGGPGGSPGARVLLTDTTLLPPPSPVPLSDWNAEHAWITRDGKRIAYWERTGASAGRMMSRKVDGAQPTGSEMMHPPLAADESGDTQCTWYNKGTGALVATRKVEGPNKRLYRTSFADDGTTVIKPVTDGTRHVGLPILSPDQKHVAFAQGDDSTDPDSRLFIVDISADEPTTPTELNGPVVTGGAIPDDSGAITFRWAPNSKHAAYTASALDAGKRDAFLVDITQPGKATRLNEDLPSESSKVASVAFSPNGAWIALIGELETAGVSELFLVPLVDGRPGEPRKANDAMAAGELVSPSLAWSPDGRYLAYVIEDELGATRARLVELGDGTIGTPVPVGEVGDRVSNLRFLSAGF